MSGDQQWQQRTNRLADRVAGMARPEPQAEAPAAATTDKVNRRKPARLRLQYADGTIGLMNYAYLMEVLCTSHQHLNLVYTNAVIHLTGERLDALLDDLALDKATVLTCHNPRLGHPPPEPGQTVIRGMKRLTHKDLEEMLKKNPLE